VDQQLCRWLLLSLMLPSNQLTMTQELIANMLGVRREGVTKPRQLHKLGVIRYARGQITVLGPAKVEKLCCECYAVVRKRAIAFLRARASVRRLNARMLLLRTLVRYVPVTRYAYRDMREFVGAGRWSWRAESVRRGATHVAAVTSVARSVSP